MGEGAEWRGSTWHLRLSPSSETRSRASMTATSEIVRSPDLSLLLSLSVAMVRGDPAEAKRRFRLTAERTCKQCHAAPARDRSPYCSIACKGRAHYQRTPRRDVTCEACGETFNTGRSNQRFCSKACQRRRDVIQRACVICHKPFEVRRTNTRWMCCSPKCGQYLARLRSYGLSGEDYHALTSTGRCSICDRKIKKWHVDHDHQTGEVYGVICSDCNTLVLPGIRRDPEVARRAALYLADPPARKIGGRFINADLAKWKRERTPLPLDVFKGRRRTAGRP